MTWQGKRRNQLEPGVYDCWRVLTRGPDTTGGRREITSDPFTSEAAALDYAEKEKAWIDRYHGPYSRPWLETTLQREITRLPLGNADDPVIAWSNGNFATPDVVAVVRSEQIIR